MKIRWSPRARRQLRDIYLHILDHDPAAAERVQRVLQEVIQILAEHPRFGRPGRVDGTRELVISGLPYIVPYRVRNETVEIIAVLHAARRWPRRFE